MSSLLVVVGVNGRQGTAVAHTFLKLPGWRVRGLTSSPLCPASEKWRALGVEIFEVDLNNESSVRAAVRDATAIFMVTDFYAQLADHSVKTFASLTSKPAEGIACQRDYQAGKTLLFAAADVPGLQRVVLSTIRTKPISMRGREQVKAKVQLVHWLKGTFPELWQKTSYIQPCLRMEDLVSLLKRVSKAITECKKYTDIILEPGRIAAARRNCTMARGIPLGQHDQRLRQDRSGSLSQCAHQVERRCDIWLHVRP